MSQAVPAAPYREAVTDTSTPVTVTTYRLIEELFESKRDGDVAHVTFTELRALVHAGQRALLADLEQQTRPEPTPPHMRLPRPWEVVTRPDDDIKALLAGFDV
jgi:hypothetical protein